jgi:general transcription factor IIIA
MNFFRCPVEDCRKLFSTQQNLRRHHNRYHTNQLENVCNICNKSFKKHQQLKIHQFEHTGIKPFKYCLKFLNFYYLFTDILNNRCPHEGCDKSFLQPSKLKAHSKIHAGYTCSSLGCDKHFATWSLLQEHRRETHKKGDNKSSYDMNICIVYFLLCVIIVLIADYSCDTCGKIFTTKATLCDHLRTHQEVRPVFHCPVEGCSR